MRGRMNYKQLNEITSRITRLFYILETYKLFVTLRTLATLLSLLMWSSIYSDINMAQSVQCFTDL